MHNMRIYLLPTPQNLKNWYQPILHYPEHRKPGCPRQAIPAAVARNRTRPTAKGPEVAAGKAVKN